MKYLQIEFGNKNEPSKESLWVKVLKKIIPAANPDMEPIYQSVTKWWLEVDEGGEPKREIGFDIQGQAIVLGPIGDNHGLLVDTGKVWDDKKSPNT